MVLELRGQVSVARSYANRRLPRRVMMLIGRILVRFEEKLTNVYYHRRGLWTTGIDLNLNGAGCGTELMGYVPTHWRSLRGTFRNWPITSDDVLLDYGSGKGRTIVWAAANFPFRRIIGVELNAQLRDRAEANLARWKGRMLCDKFDLVLADATEYEVPDDVTIVFFGNPFVGAIFEKVVRKVEESLARNPRELAVLYYHPCMHETLIGAGFSLEQEQTFRPTDWAIYRYAK